MTTTDETPQADESAEREAFAQDWEQSEIARLAEHINTHPAIAVEYSRLDTGDIHKAMSVMAFSEAFWIEYTEPERFGQRHAPKVQTFKHDGKAWTVGAGCFWREMIEAHAYQIIHPDDYKGPEPARYTYEGWTVLVKGRTYRLGPKTIFRAIKPQPTTTETTMPKHIAPQPEIKWDAPEGFALVTETQEEPTTALEPAGWDHDEPEAKQTDMFPDF